LRESDALIRPGVVRVAVSEHPHGAVGEGTARDGGGKVGRGGAVVVVRDLQRLRREVDHAAGDVQEFDALDVAVLSVLADDDAAARSGCDVGDALVQEVEREVAREVLDRAGAGRDVVHRHRLPRRHRRGERQRHVRAADSDGGDADRVAICLDGEVGRGRCADAGVERLVVGERQRGAVHLGAREGGRRGVGACRNRKRTCRQRLPSRVAP
jgi:hypothetical protein